MKSIYIYDIEADALEKIANDNDISTADVIEMLADYINDMKQANGLR